MQAFITALENRVKALETEAAELLAEGETEAANLKNAFAAELKALVAELQKVLGEL